MHLPDGGADVVSPRLSRAATSVWLKRRSHRIAASFPKRKKNLLAADFAVQIFRNRFLRKCPKNRNLARVSSETGFKVLSWGCLSKTTCSLIPSTDVVSVSGTGAVYRPQPAGGDGLVGALTGTISVD